MSLLGIEYQPFGTSDSLVETSSTSGQKTDSNSKLVPTLGLLAVTGLALACQTGAELVGTQSAAKPLPDVRIICVIDEVAADGKKPAASFEANSKEIVGADLNIKCRELLEGWDKAEHRFQTAEPIDYSRTY